jgi:hypothetical protein
MNTVRNINSLKPRGPEFFSFGIGGFRCDKLNPPSPNEGFEIFFKNSTSLQNFPASLGTFDLNSLMPNLTCGSRVASFS